MLNYHFTEKLLGLEDAIVKNLQLVQNTFIIDVIMEQRIHTCPSCSFQTSKVHDYHTQLVKHTPSSGFPVLLRLKKRRHVCPVCGKRFFENVPFLPKYQRTTNALWGYILAELSHAVSMKEIAQKVQLSQATIGRIIDHVQYTCKKLPRALSIDEFRGNSGGEKFQCILTDPKAKQVIDILPTKKAEDIYQYFASFPDRKQVRFVVMDLSTFFRSIAKNCFPKAEIVADKFHALRLAIYALEQVRKEEQKKFAEKRRKYFKRSRTLLIKHKEKLHKEELEAVSQMLSLSKPLAQAYYLKELAYTFFASKSLSEAKKNLLAFHMAAQAAAIPSFEKVSETYREWEQEVLNIFKSGLSNGFTEGCNNKIKVLKRISYGMPNFTRFRTRILHQMQTND